MHTEGDKSENKHRIRIHRMRTRSQTGAFVGNGVQKRSRSRNALPKGTRCGAPAPRMQTRRYAERGSLPIVQQLLSAGADVDAKNKMGKTPLHLASTTGNVDIAKNLISYGANVNAQDHVWRTPLHFASMSGNVDIVRILIDHGASQDIRDKGGKSAAEVICEEREDCDDSMKKELEELLEKN
ncbi:hypothetical protein BSKO_08540 [Bryopsis sp. KO-2023]|nr:hypothetical protein BSKO_08540 [Bryopsis sp. KO-2023]